VFAVRLLDVYEVPEGVAMEAKFVQEVPWQRSTWYPATPTLSVAAFQLSAMAEEELAWADRFVGVEGAVVSVCVACVVALAILE
jgi:hypothetical protein